MKNDQTKSFWNLAWVQIIASSGLVAAWFIVYLQPMLSAKSELADVRAEIAASRSSLQEYTLLVATEKLKKDMEELGEKNANLITQIQGLKEEKKEYLESLAKDNAQSRMQLQQYEELLKSETSASDQRRAMLVQELVDSSQMKSDSINNDLIRVRKEIDDLNTSLENSQKENVQLNSNIELLETQLKEMQGSLKSE